MLIWDRVNENIKEDRKFGSFSLITLFSTQYTVVERILGKHWHILQNDRVLGPLLPPKPQVIFRGVSSLKDKVVHSILDPWRILEPAILNMDRERFKKYFYKIHFSV